VAPPVVGSAAPPSHDLPMQYRLAIPPHAQAASPNLPPGLRLAIPQ
jgi:hypothetical protein